MQTNQKRIHLRISTSLAGIILFTSPLFADQIVSVVDANGNKVYINTGEPVKNPLQMLAVGRHSKPVPLMPPPADIGNLVAKTADQMQVDPKLVNAIIQVESEYNPRAVSNKGARGLMQLIPETAQRFGVRNSFDPGQNIQGGVSYLKYLLNLFGGDLEKSLAAYNAGEHAVLRAGGIPAFQETQRYVRKVTSLYQSDSPGPLTSAGVMHSHGTGIRTYVDADGVTHFTNVD